MIAFFHRAKHWQLFIAVVGTLLIFELLFFAYFFTSFQSPGALNTLPNFASFFWFFIPMMILVMTVIFGWQWSIGWGLKDKLPVGVQMNFKRFRAFMLFPIIYFILYMILMMSFFARMENIIHSSNPLAFLELIYPMLLSFLVMIPLHLFATFCLFHNFYFCAKVLKSIEIGREAQIGDYIGYFFLFWFNVIGFWIIQPSVNRITSSNWTPPPTPPGYEPFVHPSNPIDSFNPPPVKEIVPPGERLKTKDHVAFEHDDDFDGLF